MKKNISILICSKKNDSFCLDTISSVKRWCGQSDDINLRFYILTESEHTGRWPVDDDVFYLNISKNSGAEISKLIEKKSNCVIVCNAGIIFSENFLSSAWEQLKTSKHIILHPQCEVRIGENKAIEAEVVTDALQKYLQALNVNKIWASACVLSYNSLVKAGLKCGERHMLWSLFNLCVIQGIKHVTIPQTLVISQLREKLDLVSMQVPYIDHEGGDFTRENLFKEFQLLSDGEFHVHTHQLWILKELKSLNKKIFLFKNLHIDSITVKKTKLINSPLTLNVALKNIGPSTDCLFFLHQLRFGGGEKEAILLINELKTIHPKLSVTVILTNPCEEEWIDRLPSDVKVFNLGREALRLCKNEYLPWLLARIAAVLKPETVFVHGSFPAWQAVEKYGAVISKNSKIYGSLFCIDYDRQMNPEGPVFTSLPKVAQWINKIFIDNTVLVKVLRHTYGFNNAIHIKYPESTNSNRKPAPKEISGKVNVLWASRISRQKNIHLLLYLAQQFPDDNFTIYGELSEYDVAFEKLKFQKNIFYSGAFSTLDDIDLDKFDIFVYTAIWDGLPNILLEVGARGLPIMTTPYGGITDLLNHENCYIYFLQDDMVRQFQNFKSNPEDARTRSKKLLQDIKHSYSEQQFKKKCLEELSQL